MDIIRLTLSDVAMALGLIAITMGLSAWQKLGLEWQLLIATIRTIVQLIFVGYVLTIVFTILFMPKGIGGFIDKYFIDRRFKTKTGAASK